MRPTPSTPVGTPVHCDFRKYDGREHWQEDYQLLGVDEHGVWLGMPAGREFARPGVRVMTKSETVRLVTEHGYAPCYNGTHPDQGLRTYIDVVSLPQWRRDETGYTVTMIDLDLDVIERTDGTCLVVDEDEFAEHRVSMAYPEDVVQHAERACAAAFDLLQAQAPPFDGRGHDRIRDIAPER